MERDYDSEYDIHIESAEDEISRRPSDAHDFKIQEHKDSLRPVQWTEVMETERKIWMVMLFIGTSLAYCCRIVMSVVAMEMANEFSWDLAQLGFLLGCFFLGYPILQIPGLGQCLRDRVGGDNVIPVCGLCWSTLTFITPVIPYAFSSNKVSLIAMVIVRFLQGLAQGPHYPFMSQLVSARAPRTGIKFAMSTLSAATYCGILVTGILGSVLLSLFKWHSPFYLFGVLGIIWSIGMLGFSRCLKRKYAAKLANGGNEDFELLIQNLASPREQTTTKPLSFRNLITKVPFWAMLLSNQCVDFVLIILLSWLPAYFFDTFPSKEDWKFNSVPWVVSPFAAVFSGLLGDWLLQRKLPITITRKVLAVITFLGLSIPCFTVGRTENFQLAIKCLVIVIASLAFSNSCISVNAFDIAPDHGGLIHGFSHSLASLPGFLGTFIVGLILHTRDLDEWNVVFQMSGIVGLVGLIIFTFFGSAKPVI